MNGRLRGWKGGKAPSLSAGPGSIWIMEKNSARRKNTLNSPLSPDQMTEVLFTKQASKLRTSKDAPPQGG